MDDEWVERDTASYAAPDQALSVHAPLSEAEQQQRRDWFRHHLQQGVLFNRFCKLDIRRWDSDRVEFLMPYNDDLWRTGGVFHGGVICALIDTCGSGAIMAGHDFNKGSRLTTVSLAVQYLSVAPEKTPSPSGDAPGGAERCTLRTSRSSAPSAEAARVRAGHRQRRRRAARRPGRHPQRQRLRLTFRLIL